MHKFSIEEAIKFGWKTTKENFVFLVKVMLIIFAVYLVSNLIQNSLKDNQTISTLSSIIFSIIQIVLDIGLIKIALKLSSNQKPVMEDLYNHYPLFWKYLGGSILSFLIILVGFLLLIVPGIIFAIKLQFVIYLIVDKGLGPIEAIKGSWKMTSGRLLNLFAFGLVLLAVNIVGALALMVGLLWAIPTSAIATAFVYKKLSAN